MDLHFGKYEGKTTQLLVLKEPQYVHWLLGSNPSGPLLAAKSQVIKHIAAFDAKPFTTRCFGCKAPAVLCTVYDKTVSPMWWCSSCDPYQQGAVKGRLTELRTYRDALSYVEWHCEKRTSDYRELIKSMGQAKGMPGRVGASQAASFLA